MMRRLEQSEGDVLREDVGGAMFEVVILLFGAMLTTE